MSDLQLGCLGCGFIAGIHLANASRAPGVSIGAVCDISQSAAQQAHERFGGRYWTTDSDRLISDPSLDAILICTHAPSHAELAIAAMKAGKHVFVEKPMAVNSQEARAMVAAAQMTGMRLAVDLKFRFAPPVSRVRTAIPFPILLVGQAAMNPLPPSAPHRLGAGGVGIAEDLAPHVFDLLGHLAGSAPRLIHAQAAQHRHSDGHIAAVAGTLTFENGTLASFVIGDAGEWPYASKWFYEITDGQTQAVLTDHCRSATIYGEHAETLGDTSVPPHEVGTYAALTDFINAIAEHRDPAVTAIDGLRTVLLTEALRRAIQTGEPVHIPSEPVVAAQT